MAVTTRAIEATNRSTPRIYGAQRHAMPTSAISAPRGRDCSGFAVFARGEIGNMHVLAHEMFDSDQIERGHRLLGEWLATRRGAGSEWIHLQFHMAVFELALGRWQAAYERFLAEVLPAARTTQLALTDAPALLWRLTIEARSAVPLPWAALARTAERAIGIQLDPFIELHQLLAFAGAGDTAVIETWITNRRACFAPTQERILRRAAVAMHAITRRDYATAARGLRRIAPQLWRVGGSFAQNDLFAKLERWCTRQHGDADALGVWPVAA